jgi:tryptophan synthase alpha chain
MQNRFQHLFDKKSENILNVYFTAGYPNLDSTKELLHNLEVAGADIVEIGMPYSDPLADGPTLQKSSAVALENGMSITVLFEQLQDIRSETQLPIVLMGYLNPVLQYGLEAFLKHCANLQIDGLILPDMPLSIYQSDYAVLFNKYQIKPIFLITPSTSEARIRAIDTLSEAFIYVVSTANTTGSDQLFTDATIQYFKRIKNMQLQTPCLIGFGVSRHDHFKETCKYASGAIIGSAFIRHVQSKGISSSSIQSFIGSIKGSYVLQ